MSRRKNFKEPEGWTREAKRLESEFEMDAEALRLWDESERKALQRFNEDISRLWDTSDSDETE